MSFEELSSQLAADPNNYTLHIQLITALSESDQHGDELRAARESMNKVFPLSEDMWMNWINDEMKRIQSDKEKHKILQLYELAIEDYQSPSVWESYIDFITNNYLSFNKLLDQEDLSELDESSIATAAWIDLDQIRAIYAKSQNIILHHFTQSQSIWELIIAFENKILENIKASGGAPAKKVTRSSKAKKDTNAGDLDAQLSRLRKLYHNRLAIPHQQLEDTFSQYSTFESTYDNANYEKLMKNANGVVKKTRVLTEQFEKLEWQLSELSQNTDGLDHEMEKFAIFERYIDLHKEKFGRRALFERMVMMWCTDPKVWDYYLTFMMMEFKSFTIVTPVLERAIRNYNFSGDIWGHYARAYELANKSRGDFQELHSRGLGEIMKFQNLEEIVKFFFAYCEAIRRLHSEECRTVYRESIELINGSFGGDSFFRLEKSLANLEAYHFKNPDGYREVYDSLLKNHGDRSELWLEYIRLERMNGFIPETRKLYRQAVSRKTDWPEGISESWILFERECGTLDEYYEAYARVRSQMKVVEAWRAKEAAQMEIMQQDFQNVNLHREKRDRKEKKEKHNGSTGERKRVRNEESEESTGKRKKEEAEPMDVDSEKKEEVEITYHIIENSMAGNMIYVKNVPSVVDAPLVRDLFQICGEIVDVLIEGDEANREIFVEFKSAEFVKKAVELFHNQDIFGDGQIVCIQRCKPAKAVWSFDQGEEKNKLYVKNFAQEVDKNTLRTLFGKYGEVKEIRLVSKQRPFAYIDFVDTSAAEKALELNGYELSPGKPLSVAISNPSTKPLKVADMKELIVTNLPASCDELKLRELFEKFGELKGVRILKDNHGKLKGTAFVEFADEESAKQGLSLTGTEIDRRYIGVAISDPNIRGSAKKRQEKARFGSAEPKKEDKRSVTEVKVVVDSQSGFFKPPKPVVHKAPRSVLAAKSRRNPAASNVEKGEINQEKIDTKPKSQDDFRKLMGLK
ncbi:Splicing factor [Nowakowskiella sp. JEL0407]|nr:Splicing factor [Nowakowskiella sp. JEL0407]